MVSPLVEEEEEEKALFSFLSAIFVRWDQRREDLLLSIRRGDHDNFHLAWKNPMGMLNTFLYCNIVLMIK